VATGYNETPPEKKEPTLAHGVSASRGQDLGSAEIKIRQLIAAGKDKAAVEAAKELHKAHGSPATEALLLDAYAGRIQALSARNLTVDAKALLDSVRERYPAARERFRDLGSDGSYQSRMEEMIRPLNDPNLDPEHRSPIEQTIMRDVVDLAVIADCASLPPEHPLRQAASALRNAFAAVTSGPVSTEAVELPEVSRKSPLASWKLLVRAIGCFYRREDEECRRYLDAINPESAPARLIAPMKAMLGDKSIHLGPPASALVGSITADPATLRRALDELDRVFRDDEEQRIVLKAIRDAAQACRAVAPDKFERLKQHITVAATFAGLRPEQLRGALGGDSYPDAYSSRLLARAMEQAGDLSNRAAACGAWDLFSQCAVKEGWFSPNGPEMAMIYLRMAHILEELPRGLVEELKRNDGHRKRKDGPERPYYVDPDELFWRACALDPQKDSFARWLDWAKEGNNTQPERVAEAWHKARPADLEPILYLMELKESRSAFKTSLEYLAKAERIDAVNPAVRRARLRLLAGSVLRHLQQNKPLLAEEKLAELAALPQSRQGDRPAFVAALQYVTCLVGGDREAAHQHRLDAERVLGNKTSTGFLIFAVANAAKQRGLADIPQATMLSEAERAELPESLARFVELAKDMEIKFALPQSWLQETEDQFDRKKGSLDTAQLLTLAEAAIATKRFEFAYALSAEGLQKENEAAAKFLLFRAASLPSYQAERAAVCAATAAHLARKSRDMWVVVRANLVLAEAGEEDLTVNDAQAAEVIRKERADPAFPDDYDSGPDYSSIIGEDEPCNCPDCRREREEGGSPFFDDDADEFDEEEFDEDEEEYEDFVEALRIPPEIPEDVVRILVNEAKAAIANGESAEQFVDRVVGHGPGKRKKKRRK
jgi:hypothetical protein